MAQSSDYCSYIVDLLSPHGAMSARAMFGGYGIYKDRTIIGIIANDTLYFKVDQALIAQYQAHESEPFTYMGKHKPIQLSYWKVPPDILEDEEALGLWLAQSYECSKASR